MSKISMGSSTYRFKSRNIREIRTDVNASDATNFFYDKHISAVIDKYK